MRIAVIAAALMFAAPAAVAQEAASKSVTGDFDRDGKPDSADLVVADGKYELTVSLSSRPEEPFRIGGGDAADAGDFLEVRHGGTFKRGSSRGRPSSPVTFSHDVFIYGRTNGMKTIWSWVFHSFTGTTYMGEVEQDR